MNFEAVLDLLISDKSLQIIYSNPSIDSYRLDQSLKINKQQLKNLPEQSDLLIIYFILSTFSWFIFGDPPFLLLNDPWLAPSITKFYNSSDFSF